MHARSSDLGKWLTFDACEEITELAPWDGPLHHNGPQGKLLVRRLPYVAGFFVLVTGWIGVGHGPRSAQTWKGSTRSTQWNYLLVFRVCQCWILWLLGRWVVLWDISWVNIHYETKYYWCDRVYISMIYIYIYIYTYKYIYIYIWCWFPEVCVCFLTSLKFWILLTKWVVRLQA